MIPFSHGSNVRAKIISLCIAVLMLLIHGCIKSITDNPPETPRTLYWPHGQISAITLSANADRIAIGSEGGIYLFDSKTLKPLTSTLTPADGIAFHPDGELLAILYNGMVRFWNVTTNHVYHFAGVAFPFGRYVKGQIKFSPDGRFLAYQTYIFGCDVVGSGFQLWDVSGKQQILHREDCLHWENPVYTFSQDGQKLIIGFHNFINDNISDYYYIDVVDLRSGNVIREIRDMELIAISDDANTIAVRQYIDNREVLKIMNIDDLISLNELTNVRAIFLSPDPGSFLSIFYNGKASLQKQNTITCDFGSIDINDAIFSSDGSRLILWEKWNNTDGYIWDARKCQLLVQIRSDIVTDANP